MTTDSAPLAALLPRSSEATADEILNRFLDYVAAIGLELYPAQEEALLELMAGKNVILTTPTGSGKSLVAAAVHFKALAENKRSFYTSPIKALASEKFFALCEQFGPENVGMLTGDAAINHDAPIICCTAEILSNIALREGESADVDYVVMDEFHYYADRERGVAWEIPLLTLPRATFLLMSATLGDTTVFEQRLTALTGKPTAVIRREERPVPLDFEYRETPLHETIEDLIKKGKYPIYVVNFTQKSVAEEAQNLMSTNFCTREEKQAINEALRDVRFDSPYGKEISKFVRHGIGLHHAGLLPKYRLAVEKLSQKGLLKVICGTDTLGVGVNIPIRTVLFTRLCKYDGEKTGILSVRDFRQIGGRAGRKGFDVEGSVVAQAPEHHIENLKLEAKAAGKKFVRRKPPEKGYVHWDRDTFQRLMAKPPEDLKSQFTVSHGMLLNLLQGSTDAKGGGYGRLVKLIEGAQIEAKRRHGQREMGRMMFRSLLAAGIIELVPRSSGKGKLVQLGSGLQADFSLNHTLSLYLIETLAKVDPDSPTYALDVLTLVESVLENPDAILFKQVDKLKNDKMDEMRAAGADYEERMAELAKIEHPKPLREFIYATFNDFAARHPWVGQENIRPKSVAREMYELLYTFDEYVRDYGLQRSEGLVLRYVSDVYKALLQSVPEPMKSQDVLDEIAYFRTMIRGVDSSLVEEWESLHGAPGEIPSSANDAAAAARDAARVEAELRAFKARLRSEALQLLKALAIKDYEAAARCISPSSAHAWTPEELEAAMAGFYAEYAGVRLDQEARSHKHTAITQMDENDWEVRQTIADSEGDYLWVLDCVVNLDRTRDRSMPLIGLRAIAGG